MQTFPMFLKLAGRRVVIAVGGEQATRKARLMLKTEAAITVAAAACSGTGSSRASSPPIRLLLWHASFRSSRSRCARIGDSSTSGSASNSSREHCPSSAGASPAAGD